MNEVGIRNLGVAVCLQAVKDYFRAGISEAKQRAILKELRSPWMDLFSNGASIMVADHLERNPEEIRERIKRGDENV